MGLRGSMGSGLHAHWSHSRAVLALVAALTCVMASTSEGEADVYSPTDVAASQHEALFKWRNHLSKGDAAACSELYADDAALYLAAGPASLVIVDTLHIESPVVRKGQEQIQEFWSKMIGGWHGLRFAEDEGELEASTFVVSDDEVIVSGKFESSLLEGQVLSQTWLRSSRKDWQIRTEMLDIQGVLRKSWLETALNATSKGSADSHSEAEDKVRAVTDDDSKRGHLLGTSKAEEPPRKHESSSSGHLMLGFLMIVSALILATCVVKMRRRKPDFGSTDMMPLG